MKIITIARALNEERFIAGFCQGFAFSDLILIADGGSTDRTVEIARSFPNVRVREFGQRVTLADGSFMNPEPAHVNFLLDWAEIEEAPDWLIMEGADTVPNPALRRDVRTLLAQATLEEKDAALVYRYYLWEEGRYFPKINQAGPALWAWRPDRLDCHTDESFTTFFDAVMPGPESERAFVIEPPHVCLHDFRPREKAGRYAAWGRPQTPIEQSIYWPPEPLPVWAVAALEG